jgi:hypothetical protein
MGSCSSHGATSSGSLATPKLASMDRGGRAAACAASGVRNRSRRLPRATTASARGCCHAARLRTPPTARMRSASTIGTPHAASAAR